MRIKNRRLSEHIEPKKEIYEQMVGLDSTLDDLMALVVSIRNNQFKLEQRVDNIKNMLQQQTLE